MKYIILPWKSSGIWLKVQMTSCLNADRSGNQNLRYLYLYTTKEQPPPYNRVDLWKFCFWMLSSAVMVAIKINQSHRKNLFFVSFSSVFQETMTRLHGKYNTIAFLQAMLESSHKKICIHRIAHTKIHVDSRLLNWGRLFQHFPHCTLFVFKVFEMTL